LKEDKKWSKKYSGKWIAVGKDGVVLEGDKRKPFMSAITKLEFQPYVIIHDRPPRKFQCFAVNCTNGGPGKPEKYHKLVDVDVSNTAGGPTTTVNLQCDEGSDITWLPNDVIKVNGANRASKGDKIIITSTSGHSVNRQTYIQYITLDGLRTQVEAARGLSLLGEDVMRRYRRVLDRSVNPNATFTAIPSKVNDI